MTQESLEADTQTEAHGSAWTDAAALRMEEFTCSDLSKRKQVLGRALAALGFVRDEEPARDLAAGMAAFDTHSQVKISCPRVCDSIFLRQHGRDIPFG